MRKTRRSARARAITSRHRKSRQRLFLSDLLPEGAVAGSEECVLPRIPTQKMWRVQEFGFRAQACPHFLDQERPARGLDAVPSESRSALSFEPPATRWAY